MLAILYTRVPSVLELVFLVCKHSVSLICACCEFQTALALAGGHRRGRSVDSSLEILPESSGSI